MWVTLTGTSTDAQSGNLSNSMIWTSSVQGYLFTGGSRIFDNLQLGTHTITARATDPGNMTGSASITVIVAPPSTNTPPTVGITGPVNGSSFTFGQTVTFTGGVTDVAVNGNRAYAITDLPAEIRVIDDESKIGEARRAAQTLANYEIDAETAGRVAIVVDNSLSMSLQDAVGRPRYTDARDAVERLRQALDTDRGVYEIVMARGLLTREQLDRVLDPDTMIGRK